MFKQALFVSSLLAVSVSSAMAETYGFFDARSVAMGNTSVATGSMSSAAFSNPALLVNNVSDDSFIISLGVGGVLEDNGNVIDTVDSFQGVENELTPLVNEVERLTNVNNLAALSAEFGGDPVALNNAQLAAADALITKTNEEIAVVNTLNGDSLQGKASPGVMIGYSGDTFALAASYQVNFAFSGGVIDLLVPNLPTASAVVNQALAGASVANIVGNPTGTVVAIGTRTDEVGLSIATKLSIAGMDVAIGVKPKVVSAEAISYNQSLETFNSSDIINNTSEKLGSFTTLDAGFTVDISDSFRLGLVGTNLVSKELKFADGFNSIKYDTQLRAGAAYNNSFFTFAVDMDLNESNPVIFRNATLAAPVQFGEATKMLALGMELNAFDYLQLRFGYQDNIASGATSDPLLSAGLGLWLLGVNLEVSAVGNSNSLGAFVQAGVRF